MNTDKIENLLKQLKESQNIYETSYRKRVIPIIESWLEMYRSLLREDLLQRCTRGEEYVPDHIKHSIKSAEDALGKLNN